VTNPLAFFVLELTIDVKSFTKLRTIIEFKNPLAIYGIEKHTSLQGYPIN
jgi:hypothetical protein